MDRLLKEIILPSGKTAKVVTFLLHGEAKTVDQAKWVGAKVGADENGDVQVTDFPINTRALQDDALVLVGLKEIKEGEKAIVEITKELVDGLTVDDFEAILKELTEMFWAKKK